MIRVLFVCLGNICRSPSAEGVFRRMVVEAGLEDKIRVDSAGTGAWHVGEPPDRRAQAAARRRGADIGGQRARQVRPRDFVRFDFILAMDNANLKTLAALCPDGEEDRLRLFMNFAANAPRRDVPDPFYGAGGGFEEVLDLIESASRGLLEHVRARQLADHT